MPRNTKTIESFIKEHSIEFACKRVDSRPDELMGERKMRHFHCRISRETRSFSFYFSQGSAHTEDPTLADVLDRMASDSSGFDSSQSFEEWAKEYGYDADSRKAEKTFRAVRRQSDQLKRVLGESAYKELL